MPGESSVSVWVRSNRRVTGGYGGRSRTRKGSQPNLELVVYQAFTGFRARQHNKHREAVRANIFRPLYRHCSTTRRLYIPRFQRPPACTDTPSIWEFSNKPSRMRPSGFLPGIDVLLTSMQLCVHNLGFMNMMINYASSTSLSYLG